MTADAPSAPADRIRRWLAAAALDHPLVVDVEEDPRHTRWYVRVRVAPMAATTDAGSYGGAADPGAGVGDAAAPGAAITRAVTTVWLTLREHTLSYETYFMPAPEENVAHTYEYLLRASARLHGVRFAIGPEDAVYLLGELPAAQVDDDAIDTLIGATVHYADECFPTAMRIAFASRFRTA